MEQPEMVELLYDLWCFLQQSRLRLLVQFRSSIMRVFLRLTPNTTNPFCGGRVGLEIVEGTAQLFAVIQLVRSLRVN